MTWMPAASAPGIRSRSLLITKIVTALLLMLLIGAASWSVAHRDATDSGVSATASAFPDDSAPGEHAEASAVWVEAVESGAAACVFGALCGLLIFLFRRVWAGVSPPRVRSTVELVFFEVLRAPACSPSSEVDLSRLSISRV